MTRTHGAREAVVVAVTELEYRKAAAVFDAARTGGLDCRPAPANEAALAEAIRASGARHAIVGVDRYTGPLYEALPRGGAIVRFGVGHDGIDKRRAEAAGLVCANTPGVLDDSVAEHAMALMLAAARGVPRADTVMRGGTWAPVVGGELRGKTLAIIGCGAIGRRVAAMASRGFGMRVTGCEIAPVDAAALCEEWGFARVVADFREAVADAAFVSLHIPATPETHLFINAERLALLPAAARLVNTARGALVDEVALYDALAAGRLRGAALDVYGREPYAPADPRRDLRTLPNTILTPHVGSSTTEACVRVAEQSLRNVRLAEEGRYEAMDRVAAG